MGALKTAGRERVSPPFAPSAPRIPTVGLLDILEYVSVIVEVVGDLQDGQLERWKSGIAITHAKSYRLAASSVCASAWLHGVTRDSSAWVTRDASGLGKDPNACLTLLINFDQPR